MVSDGARAALKENYYIEDAAAFDMIKLDVRAALTAIGPAVKKLVEEAYRS